MYYRWIRSRLWSRVGVEGLRVGGRRSVSLVLTAAAVHLRAEVVALVVLNRTISVTVYAGDVVRSRTERCVWVSWGLFSPSPKITSPSRRIGYYFGLCCKKMLEFDQIDYFCVPRPYTRVGSVVHCLGYGFQSLSKPRLHLN